MSLETIQIVRMCPVINSFVQLENNNPANKTSVPVAGFVAFTGGAVNRLSQAGGMGRYGGRFGTQEWVEFTEALGQPDPALEAGKTHFGTNVRTDPKMPWES